LLAQQHRESLLEVAGGQAPQVQDRQHLGDLGRAPHVRRQDLAGEALAVTLLIDPPIIDARSLDLHRPRPQNDRPRLRLTVAHHQPMSSCVALLLVLLDVGGDLGFQGYLQHPPGPFSRQLVQRRPHRTLFPKRHLLLYLQHGCRLLPPVAKRDVRV
jgi:hypothetical protein